MEGELSLTPEQLANLSPEAILKLLDSGWPWPMDAVQEWFEQLWNDILYYFYQVVGWIYNRIKPAIDAVWSWLSSTANWIVERVRGTIGVVWDWLQTASRTILSGVRTLLDEVWGWIRAEVGKIRGWITAEVGKVWDWLQTAFTSLNRLVAALFSSLYQSLSSFAASISQQVSEINTWFSNEFIDPFIDWLVQLPGKLGEMLNAVGNTLWQWLVKAFTRGTPENRQVHLILEGVLIVLIAVAGVVFAAPIIGAVRWVGAAILRFSPLIGGWFLQVFSRIGGWLIALAPAIGLFFRGFLSRFSGWFLGHIVTLLGAGGIITLEVTGKLEDIIRNFVTPAIVGVFDWFEAQGPVTPGPGKDMSEGITKLAEFTISGLAAMTLAGEMLAPLKHIGLGHISAIIFDLINYQTLTGAFMAVLAVVYIKTPLTYYYQKIARPNLPKEQALMALASEYMLADEADIKATIQGEKTFDELAKLNEAKFVEMMAWHGYPDEWSKKLFQQADTPMRYFALGAVARQGMWDEEFMRDELRNSGYSARGSEFLLDAFRREATGELRTLMTGVALTRFKEGLDNVDTLTSNLMALGVQPTLMEKYIFAAQLSYLTDYQTDLLAYYKDAYHRREIEETELRRGLASLGLNPQRIDLTIARESIRQLKATSEEVKPPKTLTASQIGTLYKDGFLERRDALKRLGEFLPEAEDRTLFLILYQPVVPEVPTPATLSAVNIGNLYKQGVLTFDEAKERLAQYLPNVADQDLFLKLYQPED